VGGGWFLSTPLRGRRPNYNLRRKGVAFLSRFQTSRWTWNEARQLLTFPERSGKGSIPGMLAKLTFRLSGELKDRRWRRAAEKADPNLLRRPSVTLEVTGPGTLRLVDSRINFISSEIDPYCSASLPGAIEDRSGPRLQRHFHWQEPSLPPGLISWNRPTTDGLMSSFFFPSQAMDNRNWSQAPTTKSFPTAIEV